MTSLPTNQATIVFNGIINALITGGEAAAETYLEAQFPLLDAPVIKQILDEVISYLGGYMEKETEIMIDFLVLNFQTQGEDSAVYRAMVKINAQGGGDTDAAKQAWQGLIGGWNVAKPTT